MSVTGSVFQACSFNHSDISPSFKINNLRVVGYELSHTPSRLVWRISMSRRFNDLKQTNRDWRQELCKTSRVDAVHKLQGDAQRIGVIAPRL